MSESLFDAPLRVDTPLPVEVASTHTERTMLDALHRRYSQRHGNGQRYIVAEHVRNQGGFGGYWGLEGLPLRTADALVVDLWPSTGHPIDGFEIKVSRSDWLTELKDPEKAEAFRPYCRGWWLVVPDVTIVRDDLPDGWGLLALDRSGELRIKRRCVKADPLPMEPGMIAAWMRAAVKTSERRHTCP